MRELYFFRHGETDYNAQGRFQGHLDIPLNEQGRAQADALGKRLRTGGISFDLMLSSDLARARETAERVLGALTVTAPLVLDSRLREAMLGDAEGHTWEEIKKKFGDETARRWRSNHPTDADISYPGGETGIQVLERVRLSLIEQLSIVAPTTRTIGVSCHGGVLRRFLHSILPEGTPPIEIPNGVVYRVEAPTGRPERGVWSVSRLKQISIK
ncbi:MAG: histidine phosphatase family protein [Bdellovibrionota bacterium]